MVDLQAWSQLSRPHGRRRMVCIIPGASSGACLTDIGIAESGVVSSKMHKHFRQCQRFRHSLNHGQSFYQIKASCKGRSVVGVEKYGVLLDSKDQGMTRLRMPWNISHMCQALGRC
jgi:hypothetical protein